MDIKHKTDGQRGFFYIEDMNKVMAELVYSLRHENVMRIEHTEVDDALKGKNTGKQLVNKAIEFARINQYKIVPRCPFARAIMEKRKEELKDVLIDNYSD